MVFRIILIVIFGFAIIGILVGVIRAVWGG